MQAPARKLKIEGSVVLQKNWEAINVKNPDGSRKYRYIVNKGSSRSTKTYSLIDLLDMYCRQQKNKRCTIWRDTKKDAVDTVGKDMELHFTQTGRWLNGFTFHATTHVLTYQREEVNPKTKKKEKVKSTIEYRGANETTAHGLTQSVAWFNEPYKIGRVTFDQVDQRTEDFILIDYNPKEGHWVEDIMKDPRCLVIHSTFRDNPWCPVESRMKILSYQPVEACSLVLQKELTVQQAKEYDLIANPLNFSPGLIRELLRCRENEVKNTASLYNWQVYGLGEKAEKPNRIFNFKEISLEKYLQLDLKRYYAVDWGAIDAWAILEAKYRDGCLYLHELNYASENEIRRALSQTERLQIIRDDESDDPVDNEGLVVWMFTKLGIPYDAEIVCDPNRPLKIRALRRAGWEYAVEAPKPPGSIIDGIDAVNDLKVYYTSSSKNLKYEQENYSRKVDRFGTVLEEPEDFNNHCMDDARYITIYLQENGVIVRA